MNAAADPLQHAEQLLAQLEAARAKLEQTEEPDAALELLDEIARLAREAHAEIERAKHELDHEARPTSFASSSSAYLGGIELVPELGDLAEAVRYGFEAGGKRVRPVICLATGEAAGAEVEHVLPAAAALELVHSFSLVHDDLPALDNDDVRRGRPSTWARFGEADAILAGDALLAEAFRQAAAYPTAEVSRELAEATLGMIGGQHLDIHGEVHDLAVLHRLKTGRLFAASVGCALWAAEVPVSDQLPWREFGEELGLLFQIVDDVHRRGRLLRDPRRRRRARPRDGRSGTRARAAGGDRRRHVGARRDRHRSRRAHQVVLG